ncbi:hypothetical protein [Cytobacillus firmus]|uniref:Uncharacterized protein n=1 Tax=Cytobacillus firmus DS1 TaxID=1307436 RepID=W7LAC5_CYTFI|nr:hypothetical protein [Cytobacillus firmus]EWG08779.1 hypothetical protein PBF_22352 [Cytobacillus firmus DS1]
MNEKVKRFLLASPSNFKIVGFMVGIPEVNVLTGEQGLAINCRIANNDGQVNITPFLEQVEVVR